MSDTVKIRLLVNTGFPTAKHKGVHELPRDDWEAMTEQEREDFLDDLATSFRDSRIECSAWVDGEE